MSELLALSRILDKNIMEMTDLEKIILSASVIDEDLANKAAEKLEGNDEISAREILDSIKHYL